MNPVDSKYIPTHTKAIIFDLDGTLYDQNRLRRRMFLELLLQVFRDRRFIREIYTLYCFRKNRELLSENGDDDGCLEHRQYAEVADELGLNIGDVRAVVQEWICDKPLGHIGACIYPGAKELFDLLTKRGIKIAVFSDYPCRDKLDALDLPVDEMVCSTETEVDRFKPNPKGLLLAAEKLSTPIQNCLFIGDREDRDGECAKRVGMPYFILSQRSTPATDWYRKAARQLKEEVGFFS